MLQKITKLFAALKANWTKWSLIQKGILGGVVIALVGGLFFAFLNVGTPTSVAILSVPIRDTVAFDRISMRLDEEGISYRVTADNRFLVSDSQTARRARGILVREDLIPSGTDPWALFDVQRWTITQLQEDVNFKRSITKDLENHIKAMDDVDAVSVTLVLPKKEIVAELQDPTTASVIITPRPGSDIVENKRKVQGIERLIQFAVQGLQAENITILDDTTGVVLNDFEGLELNTRFELGQKINKEERILEARLINKIDESLAAHLSADRVNIFALNIELKYIDEKVRFEKTIPVMAKEDDPKTSWDDSEVYQDPLVSMMSNNENFEGTNFNPEGPAGAEGQMPDAYKALTRTPGKYEQAYRINNYEWSKLYTDTVKQPFDIERLTVGIALDGTWEKVRDAKGNYVIENGSIKRVYHPVPAEQLASYEKVLISALGIYPAQGDDFTLQTIPKDRTAEFAAEDAAYLRQQQIRTITLWAIIGVISLFILFVVVRVIMKENERRRRLREEELARQHQAMREAALRNAEEEAMEPEMTPEDRARLELQENVINTTRENPEDVSLLIRAWLQEE